MGFVGRLTDQKGLDLIVDVMQHTLQTSDVQWAILGTGQPKYHKMLQTLAERFPQKVALRLEFSNPLAHRIEAGADIFLMPSRFEPCGLNQLYSLRYGTVPLVRATGGLADTITGYDPQSPNPAANGFVFQEYSPLALSECLRQACDTYRSSPTSGGNWSPPACARIGRGPRARRNTWSCIEGRWSKAARPPSDRSRHSRVSK